MPGMRFDSIQTQAKTLDSIGRVHGILNQAGRIARSAHPGRADGCAVSIPWGSDSGCAAQQDSSRGEPLTYMTSIRCRLFDPSRVPHTGGSVGFGTGRYLTRDAFLFSI